MKTPPSITVQLVHLQGPLKGQIQEFSDDVITFGRQVDCRVAFPKDLTTISRLHAEIVREGNRFKITDKSANGTFVNGKRVMEAYLKDGDVIMFTEGGPKASFLSTIIEAAPEPPSALAAAQKPDHVVVHPEPGKTKPQPSIPERPVVMPAPVEKKPTLEPPEPREEKVEPVAPPGAVIEVPGKSRHQPQDAQPSYAGGLQEKGQMPLFIQFGPALRSYKELPVIIGKNASSDFVINLSSIMDRHAQIVYSEGAYRIRDLTGKNLITVNGAAAGFEAVLKAEDIIYLSPGGPALRFIGEGRLAEYEPEVADEDSTLDRQVIQKDEKPAKGLKGFMDFFKK